MKLQKAGFKIENDRLQLEDWLQLGELKQAVDTQKESQHLLALATTLSAGVARNLKR